MILVPSGTGKVGFAGFLFLQNFNLLDEQKQVEIEKYLTDKDFQLVIEMVGKTKIENKNCILLKDMKVVESYDETSDEPKLV